MYRIAHLLPYPQKNFPQMAEPFSVGFSSQLMGGGGWWKRCWFTLACVWSRHISEHYAWLLLSSGRKKDREKEKISFNWSMVIISTVPQRTWVKNGEPKKKYSQSRHYFAFAQNITTCDMRWMKIPFFYFRSRSFPVASAQITFFVCCKLA